MSNKPQMTIITPVYNGLPYIKECVGSVLAQDFQDWEMLISDDGSNDGTRAYLETITDSRIQIFIQEKNLGIFGNLNFLFNKAKAVISQILCQDDYFITNTALNSILKCWISCDRNIGFFRFNQKFEKMLGKINAFEKEYLPKIVKSEDADLFFFIFGNIPGNLSNVSLKTDIVQKLGGFRVDLFYAGDFEFWSRAATQYSFGIIDEYITYVRRHDKVASIFLNKKGELYPQSTFIYQTIHERLKIKHGKQLLRLFYNIEICSSHMRTAIKNVSQNDYFYFKSINNCKTSLHYPPFFQLPLVICFSINQKLRQIISLKIIKFLIKNI